MIGIVNIGFYIPEGGVNNLSLTEKYQVTEDFINNKIGFTSVARKPADIRASDLCVAAFQQLENAEELLSQVDFICVCTQNGDYGLPHTAAIVQDKLGVSENCASFDIGLGCSGYVYSLHVAKDFMAANGLKTGLLFTADPYSEILDENDKNTALLFGDASSVTVLGDNPRLSLKKGVFRTAGSGHKMLIKEPNKPLYMHGREIFNFAMRKVPALVSDCLAANRCTDADIDLYLLHQASKYMLDKVCSRMGLDESKVPFTAGEYGNTVSSTVPILLAEYLKLDEYSRFLLCGFGVGLSMAATIVER